MIIIIILLLLLLGPHAPAQQPVRLLRGHKNDNKNDEIKKSK